MVDWENTAIHGGVDDSPCYTTLTHATRLEQAVMVVKQGAIKAHPERKRGRVLLDKPIEVVWLSPNEWSLYEGNAYGCVAFDFKWSQLIEEYGSRIYGLEVLNSRMPTSRVLFTNNDLANYFGDQYDFTADGTPWRIHEGQHYIKKHCVLQIALDTPCLGLFSLEGIRFIDQKRSGARPRLSAATAARMFLSRAVGEQLPMISGFCGINQATNQPYEQLSWACRET